VPARGGLRVIAGSARGRVLVGPPGRATRPTAGRLREALFSMLEAVGVDFSSTLDLYAGTGALGIEALSRGAEACTFVEADPRSAGVVRQNLERTGFLGRGTVVTGRVGRWRPPVDATFTLVLADPPYDDVTAWASIERSIDGALDADATLVVEHAARRPPPPALARRPLWRDRRHGDGAVAVYRAASERPEPGSEEHNSGEDA
jgi:16S rRNA (guanine966-N2)-methyltransferase